MKKIVNVTQGTSATLLNSMIAEKAAQGEHIYNLAAGDPNLDVPLGFIGGLHYCSKRGLHNYTESQGLYNLRAQIDIPERVIISNGAKQLLYMSLMAVASPGDRIIVFGPCWSSYFEICKMLKLIPIYMEELPYVIPSDIAAVLFNNPNNPTGRVYDKSFCDKLYNLCLAADCWLISDEIYSDIIYDDTPFYSMKNKKNVIYISGFSKSYCLTGWRFGYAIAEPEVIKQITLIQSQMSGPPNTIIQHAILKNWGYWYKPDINIYKERRDLIAENNDFLMKYKPAAGFYYYIPITGNSFEFCKDFLNKYNIALTPGDEYGRAGTIRLSFAAVNFEELKIIKPYLDTIK